jgi:prophage DNA circulation protein
MIMNLNKNNNNGDKLIACEEKIEKMTLQVFILRNNQNNLSNKIDKKEEKINKQKVKYAVIKKRQTIQSSKIEATSAEMAAKEEARASKATERAAKEEARASKATERAAAKEIKTYISTATQLQAVSKLSNEHIINLVNSNDISIDNLFRITGERIQEEQPSGWNISTFKARFIQDFGSTNWLKGMQHKSNSISSAFYRMCPESNTSRSKITRKLRGIPSFVKSTSTSTYIFVANLYLDF